MKKLSIGILAHVDSGKTTLSEALMYCSGNINKLGRVDHKNCIEDDESYEVLICHHGICGCRGVL